MNDSVASVSIVFNSAGVLPRQMEALLRQTRPLQEIIVVDNASTDGTAKVLAEKFPQVTVLRMPENVGAGGALEAGLHYAAITKRHGWVWTFDDDSVPSGDALEKLLDGISSLGNSESEVGIAAALAVHRKTGTMYPPLLWRDGYVKLSDELRREPVWLADLVIVSGSMVRREVIEKIGLPRADFFMDFIDFEYCLRARSQGYRVAVIPQSKIAHEIGNSRRVRFLGYSHFWMEHTPWREYYISRNIVYAFWWLYPNSRAKRFVIGFLVRHAGAIFLFSSGKVACLIRLAQGFWDGYRGKLGIRFRPSPAVSSQCTVGVVGAGGE